MSRGPSDGDDDAPNEIASEITVKASKWTSGEGPRDDLALFLEEAATLSGSDPIRTAPLHYAAGHLQETFLADSEAATRAYQEATSRDATFVAALWPLRRLLSARGDWAALVALLDVEVASPTLPPSDQADLWLERGRILEDRLGREADATASYRSGLGAAFDHPPALLALLVLSLRTDDLNGVEDALAGLARIADDPGRRVVLTAELARVQRTSGAGPQGLERALQTVRDGMASVGKAKDGEPMPGLGALLRELEQLTRVRELPKVEIAALDRLIQAVAELGEPSQATTIAALLREKAHLLRDAVAAPAAAMELLLEALRLEPGHTLVAAELMDIGVELGRPDVATDVLALSRMAPGDGNPAARDAVLRQVEVLAGTGQSAEALAILDQHAELVANEPRTLMVRAALQAQVGDIAGLVNTFERDAGQSDGSVGAHAYVRAGALTEWILESPERAEELYRKALALVPNYRPALDALERRLRTMGRARELSQLWDAELANLSDARSADRERQSYLLESLAALHRDQLSEPNLALQYQRRLIAVAPKDAAKDVRRWVRARDLEIIASAGSEGDLEVATLTELAARADDPATAAALRVEAARITAAAARNDDERARAERLFRGARVEDRIGLAAAGLEAVLADPLYGRQGRAEARLDAIATELAVAEKGGEGSEIARGLRYRLAFHQAAERKWKEAVASLRPLRDRGDGLARAWSCDLARRAHDADLEVSVLAEPGSAPDAVPTVLPSDLGEAQERLDDPSAAGNSFARALTDSPSMDAALGLLRRAAAMPTDPPLELFSALRAIADLSTDSERVALAARREAALLGAACGQPVEPQNESGDGVAAGDADAVEDALLRWVTGVRGDDSQSTAAGLLSLALGSVSAPGEPVTADGMALLARAAGRARLGGVAAAERVYERASRAAPNVPALLQGLSDLPVNETSGVHPSERAKARAARTTRAEGALAAALDLERALDAEVKGDLGEALDAFGRVLAHDPERLDAMEGVRRLAHAAGDRLGEARTLARLGTLVRGSAHAATMFTNGAGLYEEVGKTAEALDLYWRVLEERPGDAHACERLTALLTADFAVPGRAAGLDSLLGHKLGCLGEGDPARVPLLLQRAENRLHRLGDRENAIQDFKRILKIVPDHEAALRVLSSMALSDAAPGEAVALLERYLAVVDDESRAAQARLDLARAYEALQDLSQAREVLHHAATVRPADALPRQQLSDLSLRAGDWRSAVETLRAWEQSVSEPARKAQLHLRIGILLRDNANDRRGAAASFQLAAKLDPMGNGAEALIALYESLRDPTRRQEVIEGQITALRRALESDPLDVARLRRLKEILDREAIGGGPLDREAVAPVTQVLALLGDIPEEMGAGATPRAMRSVGLDANAFWTLLAYPGALGFLTEIWSHIAGAAQQMFPADLNKLGISRQTRVARGSEPRLAWVEATAAALGIPSLSFHAPQRGWAVGRDEALVLGVELPEPTLVFDRAALAGGVAARFRFGRALALLRARATLVDWMTAADLQSLFLATGIVAGQTAVADADGTLGARAKVLAKVLGRKEKKALTLQSSRFGFEVMDAAAWQKAVVGTADRLGLIVAGDVAATLRAIADLHGAVAPAEQLAAHAGAMSLLRFALSARYVDLRGRAGLAGGNDG